MSIPRTTVLSVGATGSITSTYSPKINRCNGAATVN